MTGPGMGGGREQERYVDRSGIPEMNCPCELRYQSMQRGTPNDKKQLVFRKGGYVLFIVEPHPKSHTNSGPTS